MPLMQIARQAELGRWGEGQVDLAAIEVTADAALKLLDSYVLSTQFAIGQQSLALEPVSIGAALYDAAAILQKLAKLYGCKVDLQVHGACGLVMAHPKGLQSAITSLGYSFINALGSQETKQTLVLSAMKTKQGVTAGVFSSSAELGSDMFARARKLYGHARQPLPQMSYGNGAGIFVADALLDAMSSKLRVTRQHNLAGLAATFLPSQQLALL